MAKEIYEYRGVQDLVCAKVLKDTSEAYETGEVFDIAGTASIGRTTENSSESHYYDNMPAVVITSTGSDTITAEVSAIPLDVLAKITGQDYDEELGVFYEGNRQDDYYAIGYKTKKTNGNEVYVWRLKGKFSIPDQTNATEDSGTTANGQSITFTGIQTTYKFAKTGKGCKALNVDVALDKCDVSTFFDAVQTPDTLKVKE